MITSIYLRGLGFTQHQAMRIMSRLTKNCDVKNVKTNFSYHRNGKMCYGFQFANGIEKKDAAEFLAEYCKTAPFNSDKIFWEKVLEEIETSIKNIIII